MKRTRTYSGPAKGFPASGNRKFCVAFEPDQFERINTHAKEANLTPAEAVRSLVCFAFDRLDTEAVADAKQAAFRAEGIMMMDVLKLTPLRRDVLERCAAFYGYRPSGKDWQAIHWLERNGLVWLDHDDPRRDIYRTTSEVDRAYSLTLAAAAAKEAP